MKAPIVPTFTAHEYKIAFLKIEDHLSQPYLAMLGLHFRGGNRRITPHKLAEALDFENFNAVNIHYGKIGGWLSQALNFVPTGDKVSVFVDVIEPFADGNSELEWEMREPVAEALLDLGWV